MRVSYQIERYTLWDAESGEYSEGYQVSEYHDKKPYRVHWAGGRKQAQDLKDELEREYLAELFARVRRMDSAGFIREERDK